MANTRRDFFFLWAQAALAAHQHSGTQASSSPYPFKFFTPPEREVLRRAAAAIVPADERSGGAAAARVEEYIDFIVFHGAPPLQQAWRSGLAKLAPAKDVNATLLKWCRNEFRPRTADERFFVLLKGAVTEAFYTSEEGISKELGYQGMGFLMEFPDFSKDKAERPANYRPLLQAHS
ncbi:MAG: gluconate 2-dehydrogenase subunit 3 family protein [Acidobacteria bacterium]|nr:gluconate 2-dehydrogenase subunit 3 family protein [Acidobacteriota bacterium]